MQPTAMHTHGIGRHMRNPPTSLARNPPVCMRRPQDDAECLPCHVRHNRTYGKPWYCRTDEMGWQGFAAPRGILFSHSASRADAPINAELGLSHALLPIAHTHTKSDSAVVGLWFYYARGCSDAAWPVGRTLLVRNRCHAAVAIHQRAQRPRHSWDQAVSHVAASLAHASTRLALVGLEVVRALDISAMTAALDECARGNLSVTRPAPLALAAHTALDFVTTISLRSLRGTPRELDTVQMYRQPQGDSGTNGMRFATEIWDIRNLMAEKLGQPHPAQSAQRPRLAWLNGSVCPLSPTWASCLACKGSQLELACAFRCTMYRPQMRPRVRMTSEMPACTDVGRLQMLPSYGGYFASAPVRQRHARLGPAGISVAWVTPPCEEPDLKCAFCNPETLKAARAKNPGSFTVWTEQLAALGPQFQGFSAATDDNSLRKLRRWRDARCFGKGSQIPDPPSTCATRREIFDESVGTPSRKMAGGAI